jgi:hypothetical protein
MALRGPHATAASRCQHHTIRGAISGALRKKVAQGTRNPLAIGLRNCVLPTVGSAEPGTPRKNARPLIDLKYKELVVIIAPQKKI